MVPKSALSVRDEVERHYERAAATDDLYKMVHLQLEPQRDKPALVLGNAGGDVARLHQRIDGAPT